MTPEAQRVAIAELRGWIAPFNQNSIGQLLARRSPSLHWGCAPDYLNDLNAIHEAVLTLKASEEHKKYCDVLREAVKANGVAAALLEDYWTTGFRLLNATAAQQAEALLRTRNLWKESK